MSPPGGNRKCHILHRHCPICSKLRVQTFIPEKGAFEVQKVEGMLELVAMNGNVVTDEENNIKIKAASGYDGPSFHATRRPAPTTPRSPLPPGRSSKPPRATGRGRLRRGRSPQRTREVSSKSDNVRWSYGKFTVRPPGGLPPAASV